HAAAHPRPLRDITVFAITDQTTSTDQPAPTTEPREQAAPEAKPEAPPEAPEPEAPPEAPEPEAPPEAPTKDVTEAETVTEAREEAGSAREKKAAARGRAGYLFGSGFMPAPL
ncbi:hypothetical protein PDG61_31870, partial [Mycolicibacterium sp. BiH015]|nr:hypothetical protein [Mycolicibacterium sp. BiH015]